MPLYKVGPYSFGRNEKDRNVWEVYDKDGKTILATYNVGAEARAHCDAMRAGVEYVPGVKVHRAPRQKKERKVTQVRRYEGPPLPSYDAPKGHIFHMHDPVRTSYGDGIINFFSDRQATCNVLFPANEYHKGGPWITTVGLKFIQPIEMTTELEILKVEDSQLKARLKKAYDERERAWQATRIRSRTGHDHSIE